MISMAFCSNCGAELHENADVCVQCGCLVRKNSPVQPDQKSFGWGLLGFLVPILGLILWLLWKDETPKKAKSVGVGALISAITSAIFLVLYIVFVVVLMIFAINGTI